MNVGRQVDFRLLLCHSRGGGGGADEVGTLSIFFDGHSHGDGDRKWVAPLLSRLDRHSRSHSLTRHFQAGPPATSFTSNHTYKC